MTIASLLQAESQLNRLTEKRRRCHENAARCRNRRRQNYWLNQARRFCDRIDRTLLRSLGANYENMGLMA